MDNLARGLAELGHEVRLFTVGESTSPVTRLHHYAKAVQLMGDTAHELAHLVAAYDALGDVDVIHDHTLAGPFVAAARPHGPALAVTQHGRFSADMRLIFTAAARRAAVVAISHAQAREAGDVPVVAVIHHGVDTDLYRAGPGDGEYLLFVGRMSADKGPHRAIKVARRAGRRLVMVTKMREGVERDYFHQAVEPLLGSDDEVLVEPELGVRLDLLRHAEVLLNPITWPEPFGLVMPEALACGTPVLAFPYGAAPEIIDHGRTGFLCADEDEMVRALPLVPTLDRAECRAAAEQRFSRQRMAVDHEGLYCDLVEAALPDGRR